MILYGELVVHTKWRRKGIVRNPTVYRSLTGLAIWAQVAFCTLKGASIHGNEYVLALALWSSKFGAPFMDRYRDNIALRVGNRAMEDFGDVESAHRARSRPATRKT